MWILFRLRFFSSYCFPNVGKIVKKAKLRLRFKIDFYKNWLSLVRYRFVANLTIVNNPKFEMSIFKNRSPLFDYFLSNGTRFFHFHQLVLIISVYSFLYIINLYECIWQIHIPPIWWMLLVYICFHVCYYTINLYVI